MDTPNAIHVAEFIGQVKNENQLDNCLLPLLSTLYLTATCQSTVVATPTDKSYGSVSMAVMLI
jgi:hypothetical protein